jgi:UDP-N-acetylglucosamine--N-acetylmuramyl-(pentapeptide) pyrophosphoryl-undecaprenol N-acetylglucosamine transferase
MATLGQNRQVRQGRRTVIIAGGGTGGHVYPGIAIAQELRRRDAAVQIVFFGTARGLETRIVPAEGFPLELIEVKALKRVGWRARLAALLLLPRTFLAVARMLRHYRPDLVLGVGGYASGPVVLVAALLGIPTLIAEQNAWPGFTNRVLARFVDAAAVSFAEAQRFFGPRARITGNPVRHEFFALPELREREAGEPYHLLITGGSQGAQAINEAVVGALPLLRAADCRITFTHQIGQTGKGPAEAEERMVKAYAESGYVAVVRPFLDRMVDEFREADLVICRAGATTVAELAAAGRPAILIPYPYAADDHQRHNAAAVERGGAGRLILQAELTPERLAEELIELLGNPHRLLEMGKASRRLGHPDAAAAVVDLGLGLVKTSRPETTGFED